MIPCVLDSLPKEDIALLWRIRDAVSTMEDIDLGIDEGGDAIPLSCHMLARAVAKLFPVVVEDGLFADRNHSWVTTKNRHVIDVYPVGILGGPILAEHSIARRIYTLKSTRLLSRGRFSKPSFRRSVRRIIGALKSAMRE